MVSEQTGQLVPDGNPRYWNQELGEVSFHFDTPFNQGVVYGRSALLALLGVWLFLAEKGGRKVLSFLLGLPLLGLAGFLLVHDLPTLRAFRIAALESGLVLEVPGEEARDVAWTAVESMTVSGWELRRGKPSPLGQNPFADLPEWETMELSFAGGDSVSVDLRRLSPEQRQSVWKAIAVRARLVEQK
jgi:hypothetical protein